MNQENPTEIMTVREAAQWLRVHEDTVRRNLKRGVLPGVRVGRRWRLTRADLAEWVQKMDREHSPALADPTSEIHRKTLTGRVRERRPALYRASRPGPKPPKRAPSSEQPSRTQSQPDPIANQGK